MKVLFVHQNFPGQFKHLAPALARAGHEVKALHVNQSPALPGVELVPYTIAGRSTPQVHRWVADLETKILRGEAAWRAALRLKQQGYCPDVIVAHPGWGESLFLKQVWPQARLGLYCEFFYGQPGSDSQFDPEFTPAKEDDPCRLQMKNALFELNLLRAEAGIAPTRWQAAQFPAPFAAKISVIHDGIDTRRLQPNPQATLSLRTARGLRVLSREDEVITFVNRNLEPYRGYHSFMRALPALLKARPQARVVIVGGSDVGYGTAPPPDAQGQPQTWKQIFLKEVSADLDLSRVHFVGRLPYADYLRVLQLSSVHVYLTYPFVLSWSLLEAMSVGCAIVASDTAPVREVIGSPDLGRLVDFFDPQALASQVTQLCADRPLGAQLGRQARAFVQQHYDLLDVCLPKQLAWVQGLAEPN